MVISRSNPADAVRLILIQMIEKEENLFLKQKDVSQIERTNGNLVAFFSHMKRCQSSKSKRTRFSKEFLFS